MSPSLSRRLVITAPLVSLLGVPVIMATRYIFAAHLPDYFARRSPTISRTSAHEPASWLFGPGMTLVAVNTITAWSLVWRFNAARIAAAEPDWQPGRRCRWLNNFACFTGVLACINLALLAIVTLRVSNDSHMAFSIVFFNAQVAAFIADGWLDAILRRREQPTASRLGEKEIYTLVMVAVGVFYGFMFLTKHLDTFGDRALRQQVYVITEYILTTMFLSYPWFYYLRLKRHFGKDHPF